MAYGEFGQEFGGLFRSGNELFRTRTPISEWRNIKLDNGPPSIANGTGNDGDAVHATGTTQTHRYASAAELL